MNGVNFLQIRFMTAETVLILLLFCVPILIFEI